MVRGARHHDAEHRASVGPTGKLAVGIAIDPSPSAIYE